MPMDHARFDALTRTLATRPSRRAALRLAAAGLLGGLLGRVAPVHARQSESGPAPGPDPTDLDSDGDGLLDDDETDVYGTDPAMLDTDGDGLLDGEEIGVFGTDPILIDSDGDGGLDGEEVSVGTDPLDPASGAVPAGIGCTAGLTDCGGACVDLATDLAHCGVCANPCPGRCEGGSCFTETCPAGLTPCGDGFCHDLLSSQDHCGACGVACGDLVCMEGACGGYIALYPLPRECTGQTTNCGDDICIDLFNDPDNCGFCGAPCGYGMACCGGVCTNVLDDPNNCGYCQYPCNEPVIGRAICVNGRCDTSLF